MAPKSLRLRVIWTEPSPADRPGLIARVVQDGGDLEGRVTEFGMQRGRSEVVLGATQPDGETLFEATVEPYTDKAGRQRFRSDFVHGPPDEPFLYLSWRLQGEASWIMRAKVHLTSLTPDVLDALPYGATLQTSVSQMGHRPAGHVQEWVRL